MWIIVSHKKYIDNIKITVAPNLNATRKYPYCVLFIAATTFRRHLMY